MDTTLYHNKNFEATPRTTLKRHPERGVSDREAVYAILDAGWVCHVGFGDEGATGGYGPVVIPTAYARVDDVLYLHGSPASRLARGARHGVELCVTVTLVDGLVLARSALHHSVNFRCVMVFGTATEVRDPAAKAAALDAFVDHLLPGRSGEARRADERELRATSVLAVPLAEASAKVATGFRSEEPGDVDLPIWAGIVPLAVAPGEPRPDDGTAAAGRPLPPSVRAVLAGPGR
jgi:nitroimidazol reductase NimA-like FMN-containing flavoprotein (pyridoxamine 5'-phosphate oxidase superfamily)